MSDDQHHAVPRVLSLLSAATEIVCRLGCAELLVGRSHGCDDPALVTALPIATAPRVDPNASSAELDAQVRVQAATGGPIYQIDNAMITAAEPTVIITQEQCRICAVTPEDLNEVCDTLPPLAKLITIMPVSLEDVLGDVMTISNSLGVSDRGRRLVEHIRRQLSNLQSSALDVLGDAPRPKVAHVEWLDPLMGSGYWIAECMEYGGGEMVHGYVGGHSQILEKIEMLSNSDYIILSPCGFSIERTYGELINIKTFESEEWQNLPAVAGGNVAIADGNKYFNRSSVASILGTAEIVAEIIHPELRGMYGHHGNRWVSLRELPAFCKRTGAESTKKDVRLAHGVAERSRAEPSRFRCHSTEKKSMTIQHVRNQIAALQLGDYNAAFLLNSPANQKRLVSVDKFKAIVSGWASFKVLTLPGTLCEYHHEGGIHDMVTSVKVDAREESSDASLSFLFDLKRSKGDDRWETDGVRIEC